MVKKRCNAGLDFPNLEVFIGVHYVCFVVNTYLKETKAACMMKYLAGTMIRRLKWARPNMNRPVAFLCPDWYLYLEKFIRKYSLENMEMLKYVKEKKKIKECDSNMLCTIDGFSVNESKMVWNKCNTYDTANKQKYMVWMWG